MASFDEGFISAKEAREFGKFSSNRDMDKFLIEHQIPLLASGSGPYNYRVYQPALHEALMSVHSFTLLKPRKTPPPPELRAWRKMNGQILALNNKIENTTDAAEKKRLSSQLGGFKTKAAVLKKEYDEKYPKKGLAKK